MRLLKSDKGYALFITLVIIILFTVLGMTMLALTSDGMKKNNVRKETVQATAQAEKGIDWIVAEINSNLTTALGTDGLQRGEFIKILNRTLNNFTCPPPGTKVVKNQIGITGSYEVCIDSIAKTYDKNKEENELRKLVKFKSLGHSGSVKEKRLNSEIEIGAEAFPETMKYAIGTNIMSKFPQNGEGNLIIHGGAHIKGDLKVDGNLITYDKGYAQLGGDKWIPSLLPSTFPTQEASSSKLVLGGSLYKISSNPSNYQNHIKLNSHTNTTYSKKNTTDEVFEPGKSPRIVKRDPVLSPIAIIAEKENYYFDLKSGGNYLDVTSSAVISNVNQPTSKLLPRLKDRNCWFICGDWYYTQDVKFTMENTNTISNMAVKRGLDIKRGNHTFKDGAYVEHNLYIGNGSTSYNTSSYDNIDLEGNIYVTGDVTIQGANLKSNAIMYVEGDVTIRHTTINGKRLENNSTGSLIVFAKGNIFFANNSVNQDTPSTIKGFFYSEQDFEMFGVGSNIKIEGGISARRIVLNALKGKSSSTSFSGSQAKVYDSYFENVTGQRTKDSRLQVIYDPDIIEIFSNLKKQEPIINKIDKAVERNRSY